ncbi:pseudouridine synthase [Pseudoalteromonas ulvae]|uniref:pseudouridine synthase n=1 Tax=Pseudoalteromonas ulvae TaxID=107327 RepID=UPI001FD0C8B1|nr:pseudouridine synthase [Pseudoalteromonas ulvae]
MNESTSIDTMRLAKYIAHAGYCSRRQASRLIDLGVVTVNGQVADHICFVSERDQISIQNQPLVIESQRYYFIYNKPVGVDCRLLPDDPTSLVHRLPSDIRLYPIGRLDKDSHGLLILTNDGDFFHQMNHPENHQEKEYLVQVDQPIDALFCSQMSQGVMIDGQTTLPCQVCLCGDTLFRITLRQGLNRQIRKMSKALGRRVIDLQRVRIANIHLDNLTLDVLKAVSKNDIIGHGLHSK